MPVLTPWDRLVFASLSAAIGALIGAVVALLLMFLADPVAFNSTLVLFSAAFFFVVGFARGAWAGEFVGEALAHAFSLVAAAGHVQVDPKSEARTGSPFTSTWLLLLYAAGVLVLAWLG